MVEIQTVQDRDLEEFRRLHNRYISRNESLDTVTEWYQAHPELLVGAYEDGELIGHCLGLPRAEDEVELAGIAVESAYQRRGIGTDLLSGFENRARSLGYRRVSLGSAGGYVDKFYLDNGYEPESVLVRLDPDETLDYGETDYDIADEQVDDGTRKLYVAVDEFDPAYVEDVRETFGDPEAIYIMEKDLSGP